MNPLLTNRKKKLKYNNVRTEVDGIWFSSQKEAGRYCELKFLEKAGQIANLQLQVRFEICPKRYGNRRARYYVADFVYEENCKKVIEDTKSKITRKNSLYSLKKALVLANYPEYEFRES